MQYERIQCVSLPRCGHNLLVSHLQRFFESNELCQPAPKKKLPFLGSTTKPTARQEHGNEIQRFHYCEYYYACRKTPCTHPNNTFQKSHDFELDLPVTIEQKYIVQYRNPIGLLISWFEMRLLKGREEDTPRGFRNFVDKNQPYLTGFHQKWVNSNLPNRLILEYEEYLSRPVESLTNVIRFFNDKIQVDQERLAAVSADVVPAKDNNNFRFIDTAREIASNVV